MAERKPTPFKSGTTDYAAIRKRMEELGIFREQPGAINGVDVTTPANNDPDPQYEYTY